MKYAGSITNKHVHYSIKKTSQQILPPPLQVVLIDYLTNKAKI